MSNYTRYTDFLKDKQFISWQLTPNDEQNTYWQHFIEINPHLNKEIQQAKEYLKTTGLNKNTLTNAERTQLLNKIQSTIENTERKRKLRRVIQLSIASSAAIILIIFGLHAFLSQERLNENAPDQELIVGNLLSNEDIQLITAEESISFQSDVEVEFNKNGEAIITQKNNEQKTVETAKGKLNTLIVPYGKRSSLSLSDGSKIWLNSGSVLEFPTQFIGDNREIHLASGEMYIEVAPDKQKPFYVQTSDFNVRVYGTKFNVSSYTDSPKSVVLVEGRVSLQTLNKQETFLSPNDQAVFSDNRTFSTEKVNVNKYTSWKNGYLQFDKTPMTEVLKQIGRYYNLSFNFDNDVNLKKRTCTGKIYLSENLDNVMTTIGILSSTKHINNNNQILITNNPN